MASELVSSEDERVGVEYIVDDWNMLLDDSGIPGLDGIIPSLDVDKTTLDDIIPVLEYSDDIDDITELLGDANISEELADGVNDIDAWVEDGDAEPIVEDSNIILEDILPKDDDGDIPELDKDIEDEGSTTTDDVATEEYADTVEEVGITVDKLEVGVPESAEDDVPFML